MELKRIRGQSAEADTVYAKDMPTDSDIDPEKVYKRISNKDGFLKSRHPIARALEINKHPLGLGAQGVVYSCNIIKPKLDSDIYRSLLLPKLIHDKLGPMPSNGHYSIAEKNSREEIKKMADRTVKELFLNFCETEKIPFDEFAIRISNIPAFMDKRDIRLQRIVGLFHKNLLYHFSHGYTDDNLPFLLMERMDGHLDPVKTVNKSPKYYLHILKSLINGADALKQREIKNRDIKPSNILYRKTGNATPIIKISDFGLMSDSMDDNITVTGTGMGTLYFMSPEQASDAKRATWQSDQFSIASTLYNIITNNNPLGVKTGLDDLSLRNAVINRNRIPSIVNSKDKQLEGIEQILAKMLRFFPDQRYPDYALLLQDIKKIENDELPTNTSPELVKTIFIPSEYTNFYTYRGKRTQQKVIAATAALAGLAFAAHKLGYIDQFINWFNS